MNKKNSFQAVGAFALLLVLACFLTAACGEDGFGYQPTVLISLNKDSVTLEDGTEDPESVIVSVVKSSRIRDTYRLEWYSENMNIATVNATVNRDRTVFEYSDSADISSSTAFSLNVLPVGVTPAGQSQRDTKIKIKFYKIGDEEATTLPLEFNVIITPAGATKPIANPPSYAPNYTQVANGSTVSLTSLGSDAIYYTIGAAPADTTTTNGTKYTVPITISASTTTVTIKAIAVRENTISPMLTATYLIAAAGATARPYAEPPTGTTVPSGTTVTLKSNTDGAEIWFTTDGSSPSTVSSETNTTTKYTTPIPINAATTIRAVAIKGTSASSIVNFTYTVDSAPEYGIQVSPASLAFASVAPLTVSVRNIGTKATGALRVELSGNNGSSFTLSKAQISSIAPAGFDSFTVTPVTGLAAGQNYIATVTVLKGNNNSTTITSQTVDISYNIPATGTPSFVIVDPTTNFAAGTYTFANLEQGYADSVPITITVQNTGAVATGNLGVSLAPIGIANFVVPAYTTPQSIAATNGTATFTVKPINGLDAGTYNATVTVSNGTVSLNKTINVEVTVNPSSSSGTGASITIDWAANDVNPTFSHNSNPVSQNTPLPTTQGKDVVIIVTPPTGFTVSGWFKNGEEEKNTQGDSITDPSYTFKSDDVGTHTVTVLVVKDDQVYSADVTIEVAVDDS